MPTSWFNLIKDEDWRELEDEKAGDDIFEVEADLEAEEDVQNGEDLVCPECGTLVEDGVQCDVCGAYLGL